jgi:hypothetical protein
MRPGSMTSGVKFMLQTIDLERLSIDAGGYLIVDRALASLPVGGRLSVTGASPAIRLQLSAWCRNRGHTMDDSGSELVVVRGSADEIRWKNAERAGGAAAEGVGPWADPRWGLAARGALIEDGGPPLAVDLLDRDYVWSDIAPRLYAQAVANQWDPATAVDWKAEVELPGEVESAVVQVMTFLVENENAALIVPARMIARLHPYFREVMQILAVQTADEARHIEIFTRRALLHREELGLSGAGGRASLQSLLDEPDFALSAFLLSVLGEGTFLDLLWFIHQHAPDPVTARVARLALRDESRHVAFGVAHVAHTVQAEPAFLSRLRSAVEHRHDVLADTSGLNDQVFDSLVVLAAGAWTPTAVAQGWERVQRLQARMDEGRRRRLAAIGFPPDEAAEISALHTRNFM